MSCSFGNIYRLNSLYSNKTTAAIVSTRAVIEEELQIEIIPEHSQMLNQLLSKTGIKRRGTSFFRYES
ncbi:hypothetical protein B4V02_19905 [Paenibacillus kribbensis]|uniref:Uncharacterized protein n=1 Tax=Paenibacillus kribbensis TaxID=172713 RepID=A0A222WS03_9BACL|nr:hypothetical protein B4V02_19905 [Paenibacillus kribbensis]